MSRKSNSFFLPFTIAFVVSIVTGFSVLYFGYYYPQKQHYKKIMAQVTTPLEETTNDQIMMDEMALKRGDQTPEVKKGSSPGKSHSEVVQQKGTLSEKKVSAKIPADKKSDTKSDQNTNLGKPIGNARYKQADEAAVDLQAAERKPAFPSSGNMRSSSTSDKPSGMDSKSAQDNPLIKALRMASERKQTDDPADASSNQPAKNPFDFILNKDKTTE